MNNRGASRVSNVKKVIQNPPPPKRKDSKTTRTKRNQQELKNNQNYPRNHISTGECDERKIKYFEDNEENNNGWVDDDNDDEIQGMIREMCHEAFHKKDTRNGGTRNCNHTKKSDSIMNKGSDDDDDKHINFKFSEYEINDHFASQLPSHRFTQLTESNSNNDEEDWNDHIDLKYKVRLEVECHVNDHLKSLHKTEFDMRMKFTKAKQQISECIRVLELHYDELGYKERQYFNKLNDCRKLILTQSQQHLNAEILKLDGTNDK